MRKSRARKKIVNIDFFKTIIDNASYGGMLVDIDRTIKYCNRNVENIFGYKVPEMVGKRTEFLYGDRRVKKSDKKEIYRSLEEKGFHKGKANGITKDGERLALNLSTFIVRPNVGAIVYIERISRLSPHRFDEDLFFQNLLDTIPDMIYFKDLDNRFIMVNRAHADALHLTPEEIIGKTDLDLFPRELSRKYFNDDNKILRTGKPVIGKIERAPRPDGGVTFVSTTKMPHYDKAGKLIGTIGITRNITDKMVAQEELHKYKDKLEDLVKSRTKELEESNEQLLRMYNLKSDFTSIVSHELRTPLTVVKEGIHLVEDGTLGVLNEKQVYSLGIALDNIERLNRLICDILDFSKLESRKMKFRIHKNDLNDVVRGVCEQYRRTVEKKGLKLKVELDESLPMIKFDSDRMIQVMQNLLNNAFKFTDEGCIAVETKNNGGKAIVSVADTGPGIHEEDLDRVFERFEQATANVKIRKHGGTGLGLAICKEIIQQHGGKIFVESQYGNGTKFYFTLPVKI